MLNFAYILYHYFVGIHQIVRVDAGPVVAMDHYSINHFMVMDLCMGYHYSGF